MVHSMANHTLGHQQDSEEQLRLMIEQFSTTQAFYIALVHAWRGEPEDAFTWLERALDEGQPVRFLAHARLAQVNPFTPGLAHTRDRRLVHRDPVLRGQRFRQLTKRDVGNAVDNLGQETQIGRLLAPARRAALLARRETACLAIPHLKANGRAGADPEPPPRIVP